MIVNFRVDTRLIHGQIVEGWLEMLDVDEILVIDDYVGSNPVEVKILKFVVPREYLFEVLTVQDVAEIWEAIVSSSKNYFILVQSVEVVKKLFEKGVTLPEINLGLVNFADERKFFSKSVYLNEKEVGILKGLLKAGVKIYVQTLPEEEKIPLEKLLKDF